MECCGLGWGGHGPIFPVGARVHRTSTEPPLPKKARRRHFAGNLASGVPGTPPQKIQKNRNALSTRLDSAKLDRAMSEIKAPVIGRVVGLEVFTVGGIITSGKKQWHTMSAKLNSTHQIREFNSFWRAFGTIRTPRLHALKRFANLESIASSGFITQWFL
jgi:hypothetical protein